MSENEPAKLDLNSLREHDGAITVCFNPPLNIYVKDYLGKTKELKQCVVAIFYPKYEVNESYTSRYGEVIWAKFDCRGLDEYNQEVPVNYYDKKNKRIEHEMEVIDESYLVLKDIIILRSEVQKIVEMALNY